MRRARAWGRAITNGNFFLVRRPSRAVPSATSASEAHGSACRQDAPIPAFCNGFQRASRGPRHVVRCLHAVRGPAVGHSTALASWLTRGFWEGPRREQPRGRNGRLPHEEGRLTWRSAPPDIAMKDPFAVAFRLTTGAGSTNCRTGEGARVRRDDRHAPRSGQSVSGGRRHWFPLTMQSPSRSRLGHHQSTPVVCSGSAKTVQ